MTRNVLTPKRGLRSRHVHTLALAMLIAAVWPASALAAPANDDFADAQLITETEGTVTGSNVGATKEPGEPDHAGNPGGHSVWYSWTAPADGNVAFTTAGSAFDTLLAVYTGGAVDSLTPVAANDDNPGAFSVGGSTVSFAVSSGVTYMVAVDGFSGKVGFFRLSWHPAPANDNFVDAQVLASASSGTVTGNARGATVEAGEPTLFGGEFSPATIWYSWTAPADGTYKFDTVGSNFDTVLAVYEGSSLDALVLVGANDDDPDRGCCSSWVPIQNATAGTIYSIAVSPLGDGDEVVLNWSPLILGTPDGDNLFGTTGDEEIRGLAGPDLLRGRGGNDALFGGRNHDQEFGGPGNDFVLDRSGADRLFGGNGDDRLNARDSRPNDLLSGGFGVDRCRGDAGDIRRRCP